MVMKDKLYRNHHTGKYYTIRNFVMAFSISCSVALVVGVSTYIVSHFTSENQVKETVKADDGNTENGNQDTEGENENPLLSYQNNEPTAENK